MRQHTAAPSRAIPTAPGIVGQIARCLSTPLGRRDASELLDQPHHNAAELAANLRDIRRLNRGFGGSATVLRHLPALLSALPTGREPLILDLATGSGDIPRAILRWGDRRGRPLRIIASDYSDEILAAAAAFLGGEPRVTLARFDARAVPLPDRGVDIVICSLALHHFSPDEAVVVLREMDRVARVGFILNDLARSRRGYAGAWLAARLTTRNRLTRHDAPLSVLRAYTPNELTALLTSAGIRDVTVTRHPWFRMAAVKPSAISISSGEAAWLIREERPCSTPTLPTS